MERSVFEPGDFVRRRSQPEMAGVVRQREWDEQMEEWRYSVQSGAATRGAPEGDLEHVPGEQDPVRLPRGFAPRSRRP